MRLFTQEEDIHEMEDKKKYPLLHKHDVISCLGMSGKWITSQSDLQVWLKNTIGQGLVIISIMKRKFQQRWSTILHI